MNGADAVRRQRLGCVIVVGCQVGCFVGQTPARMGESVENLGVGPSWEGAQDLVDLTMVVFVPSLAAGSPVIDA